eukprot:TRINITY_DN7476_c0_g1_i3.p1 TRINITY_DN7476_c0_g1~~TRINITY_DN7476_c0_g1_i3.p1  ORF type:complete len:609 (-),score=117.32 TRINITY_DN7476_c0_g1_i3:313-1929(-)
MAIFPWIGAEFGPPAEAAEGNFALEAGSSFRSAKVHVEDDEGGLGDASPKDPLSKASKFRSGIYYWLGDKLTQFPMNLLVPLLVYAVTSPLTIRMGGYKMGHAYELQIPRGNMMWDTSLEIQKDFPSSVGCMMPTLIIATNKLPAVVPPKGYVPNAAEAIFGPPKPPNATKKAAAVVPKGPTTTMAPLDVRGQAFFEANCAMVRTLINASYNRSFELKPSDFQSTTLDPRNKDAVECLSYRATHYFRDNYFTQKFMFTSRLMQKLWDQLVSEKHDAMLTVLSPKMDPFSTEAFDLTTEIRQYLKNATQDARGGGFSDVTFEMFSPSAIMMDMIKVTNDRLPIAFLGCAFVCFSLIAVAFHAALIPFKLLFTVILPISWTYGAALYIYEDGVLEWTGVPGLQPTYIKNSGPAGLDWTVPMFTLTIMLGLALDYDVFLFERVWEFREEGFGDKESIQLALSATGPIISAAGMIFALTFVAMMLGSIAITNQMGFIFIFSILVDTFVVRTILVPAMLSLSPCLNYWPSRMPKPIYTWIGED